MAWVEAGLEPGLCEGQAAHSYWTSRRTPLVGGVTSQWSAAWGGDSPQRGECEEVGGGREIEGGQLLGTLVAFK